MSTAARALEIARGELGVKESPAGSNRVKYNEWFWGGAGYPWCMAFVQWVMAQAGVKVPVRTASCRTLMRAAKAAGRWVTEGYRPGDVLIYDFPGGAATDHTGICESAGGKTVTAIEGNTGTTSASNGGEVRRTRRSLSLVVGAWRPEYGEEDEDMTGKEIYDRLQEFLAEQPAPDWAREELARAVELGITDGKAPMQLIPRYQAAIMAKRAAEGRTQ